MTFTFEKLDLEGLTLVKSDIYKDARGLFSELNKQSFLRDSGISCNFVQDNFSVSKYGVVRGLHFQRKPFSQAKLVHVLRGEICDVVVDLRLNSATFKEHAKVNLSSDLGNSLYIPEGFAHGFCSLKDNTIVMYKNSKEYNQESELGLKWDDPEIGINWPINEPILSNKDSLNYNFNDLIEFL
tara:strand:+ start:433 stop:981 length:549 start_codon:yes stop_codon:yes gene_type:complete